MQTIRLGFLAVLLAILAGCGGSASPPSKFDTLFNVSNKTDSRFGSVSIRSGNTGVEIFSGKLDCVVGREDCRIFYVGTPIEGAADLTFFDDRGVMVGAYRLAASPGVYAGVEVSARTTGLYLALELLRTSPALAAMSLAEIETRAYNFVRNFVSADGPADYFEEFAANYTYRARRDGLGVTQFLANLAQRLLNSETAGPEEFVGAAFKSAGGAEAPEAGLVGVSGAGCSNELSGFLTLAGAAAGGVQAAFPIIGSIMSGVVGLSQSACDDTSSRLDSIDSKLNELQVSINQQADRLGDLTIFTAGAAINSGEDAFQTLSQNVESLASTYRALKVNYQVASLKEYVQAVAGAEEQPLRSALVKEFNAGPLSELLRNFRPGGLASDNVTINPLGGDQLRQFETLLQDGKLNTIVSAVKLQCDNPAAGDVVNLRVTCNLFLGTSVGRLVAAHRMAAEMAADVYDLLDAYKVTDRDTVAQRSYVLDRSAADHKAALNAVFVAQQDRLVKKYRAGITGNPVAGETGMYNVFRGLDANLLGAVSAPNCFNESLGIVAVTGWFKSAANEYLETQCKNVSVPVLARYHLRINGNSVNTRSNICNVLGVLVPCDRLDIAPRRLDRSVWSWPLGYAPVSVRLTAAAPFPGGFTQNPYGNRDRIGNVIAAAPLPTSGRGLRRLSNPRAVEDRGLANLNGTTPIQMIDWVGETDYVTWMRYTQPSGVSVVFAYVNSSTITKIVCVSGDCATGEGLTDRGRPASGYGIDFFGGPQGLTLGDYGARITADDFSGARDLYGFYVRDGSSYRPIYPK